MVCVRRLKSRGFVTRPSTWLHYVLLLSMPLDSRARTKHYIEKTWPQRIEEEEGQHNVVALPLVPQNKIILPPMHIKLGLFKQFVRGLRKDSPAFEFLHECFSKLSDAKIK